MTEISSWFAACLPSRHGGATFPTRFAQIGGAPVISPKANVTMRLRKRQRDAL
jgi:hypothetical protein